VISVPLVVEVGEAEGDERKAENKSLKTAGKSSSAFPGTTPPPHTHTDTGTLYLCTHCYTFEEKRSYVTCQLLIFTSATEMECTQFCESLGASTSIEIKRPSF
jgi:hypothetical protein